MTTGIIAKFGGSSVKDSIAMLRCSHIVELNADIKIVVVSATQNTTNQLEYVAQAALRGDQEMVSKVMDEITSKHIKIAHDNFSSTKIITELEKLFLELKQISDLILINCSYTEATMDLLYSLGERMSSLLFSDLLRLRMPNNEIHLIDARKIIKTDSNFNQATPNIELIRQSFELEITPLQKNPKNIIVTQGFIGSDQDNQTTTLGREGSDYSAALLGEAMHANAIQIWTDVQGIASGDPRIIKDSVYLKRLSYDEATALATLGAKVLFPTTLLPAKRKQIPVLVGSSINSELPMTTIDHISEENFSLKAVTFQNKILSFVGTHLASKANLKETLLIKLNANFKFTHMTDVSISFKVSDLDAPEALRLGHIALKSFQ